MHTQTQKKTHPIHTYIHTYTHKRQTTSGKHTHTNTETAKHTNTETAKNFRKKI